MGEKIEHKKLAICGEKSADGRVYGHYGEFDAIIVKVEEYRMMCTILAAAATYKMLGERMELVASALEEAGFDPPLWYEHMGEKYTYTGCDALPFFIEEYANLICELAQTEEIDTVIHPRKVTAE